MKKIEQDLLAMEDKEYLAFHRKLVPGISNIIGIRIPQLRAYAKSLQQERAQAFMKELPHKWYEENNLHVFLINEIKDFDRCMEALQTFLPFVDNWAACDSLRPKCAKKNKAAFLPYLRHWLESEHTYTCRFAMEMLMTHYLDEDFRPEYLRWVSAVDRKEYYVNMMIAWYFATALAKQYDSAIVYLQQGKLSTWVHNKTIGKAVESYRITEEQKAYLRTLRKKECS